VVMGRGHLPQPPVLIGCSLLRAVMGVSEGGLLAPAASVHLGAPSCARGR
jgi:hypothetical protein